MILLIAVPHALPQYVHTMGFNFLLPASASMPLRIRKVQMCLG